MAVALSRTSGASKNVWRPFASGAVGALVAVLLNFHRFGPSVARWLFVPLVALVPVFCVGGLMREMGRTKNWRDLKAMIQKREEQDKPLEDDETASFRKVAGAAIKEAQKSSLDAEKAIETLRRKKAGARDADEIRGAQELVKNALEQAGAAERSISGTGPYHSKAATDAVRLSQRFVELQINVLEAFGRFLKAGNNGTAAEEKSLDALIGAKDRAWNRCKQHLPE